MTTRVYTLVFIFCIYYFTSIYLKFSLVGDQYQQQSQAFCVLWFKWFKAIRERCFWCESQCVFLWEDFLSALFLFSSLFPSAYKLLTGHTATYTFGKCIWRRKSIPNYSSPLSLEAAPGTEHKAELNSQLCVKSTLEIHPLQDSSSSFPPTSQRAETQEQPLLFLQRISP